MRMTLVFERIFADPSKGGDVGRGRMPNRERQGRCYRSEESVLLYMGEAD
jgi:hypothetical protein